MGKPERLSNLHRVTQLVDGRVKDMNTSLYDSRPSALHCLSKTPEVQGSVTVSGDRVVSGEMGEGYLQGD
jgi:hypothetical protein